MDVVFPVKLWRYLAAEIDVHPDPEDPLVRILHGEPVEFIPIVRNVQRIRPVRIDTSEILEVVGPLDLNLPVALDRKEPGNEYKCSCYESFFLPAIWCHIAILAESARRYVPLA